MRKIDALKMFAAIEFQIRRLKIIRRFKKISGCNGNFETPVTYQEKIQFRKLYGNHQFYALIADKYRVRDYVKARVGEKYLIPLIGAYDKLTRKSFNPLPEQFIIKANHGCKWNRVVWDKKQANIDEIVKFFDKIMKRKFGYKCQEKHYDFIKPKLVIEELLLDHGELPWNYSLFCYNGRKGFDYAITLGSPDARISGHFDKHWNVWEGNISAEQIARYTKIKNYNEMVDVARALSAEFDFVRVDLYNFDGDIYFGELTATPAGGYGPPIKPFRQRMRTEMWELDPDNRLLYRKPKKYGRVFLPCS